MIYGVKSAIIHMLSNPVLFCLWVLIQAASAEKKRGKKVGQRNRNPSDLNSTLGQGPVLSSNAEISFLRLIGGN